MIKLPTIGMLAVSKSPSDLHECMAYICNYHNIEFFYFTPTDMNYAAEKVKGRSFSEGKWVTKDYKYPDMVFDRLRARGNSRYTKMYDALSDCVFDTMNNEETRRITKLEVYDKLSEIKGSDYIIPYKRIEKITDVESFLNKYNSIIIKPTNSYKGKGVYFIEKKGDDSYLVAERYKKFIHNNGELRKLITDCLKASEYVVQKYIELRAPDGNPFDIRVHMLKNKDNEWEIIRIKPRIGISHAMATGLDDGSYFSMWKGFCERCFKDTGYKKLSEILPNTAIKIAEHFEQCFGSDIADIGLDVGITKDLKIHLIEVNTLMPGILEHELKIAQVVVPYLMSKYEEIRRIKSMKLDTVLSFSGGIDSTYCLIDYLDKNPNNKILLHHVVLDGHCGRHPYEKKAVKDILRWLDNNGYKNRYEYYESSFAYGDIKNITYDIITTSYFVGVLLKDSRYKKIKYVISSTNSEEAGTGNLEEIKNLKKRADRLALIKLIAERDDIEYKFPIYKMTKPDILKAMPPELFKLCWYCRRPAKGGKTCGQCFTCKTVIKK